jgi:hypothetical protein
MHTVDFGKGAANASLLVLPDLIRYPPSYVAEKMDPGSNPDCGWRAPCDSRFQPGGQRQRWTFERSNEALDRYLRGDRGTDCGGRRAGGKERASLPCGGEGCQTGRGAILVLIQSTR